MKNKDLYLSPKYVVVAVIVFVALSTVAIKAIDLSKIDLNKNNKIDLSDLSVLLSNLGKSTAIGDADGDAKINSSDVNILVQNYGSSVTNSQIDRSCAGSDRGLIRQIDYANATSLTEPGKTWVSKQVQNAPGIYGTQQTDRLRIVKGQTVPGNQDDAYRPNAAMRVEVRPYDNPANPTMPDPPAGKSYTDQKPINEADGDVNPISGGANTGYDGSSRSEVLSEVEPVNVTRWYGFSFYLPADYVSDPDKYLFITQFHDQRNNTASPPESLGIYGKNLQFIMRNSTNGELKKFQVPLTLGKWMRVEFGIKFAADNTGWVQMWVNGNKLAANSGQDVTGISTIRTYGGRPDAVYLKQGVYRRIGWTTTQIIHFGPMKVGKDCMDVLP